MPTDNYMHRFTVELSNYDYETIDEALEGTVADEIAQVLIEYLPALKVKVTANEQTNFLPLAKKLSAELKAMGADVHPSKLEMWLERELSI